MARNEVTADHLYASICDIVTSKEYLPMMRVIHRNLMRGHLAQRAAILLAIGLLLCLAAAFIDGVRALQS
jgi:hypothetical protein